MLEHANLEESLQVIQILGKDQTCTQAEPDNFYNFAEQFTPHYGFT